MSAAFVPFLFELRARKVKVGVQEAMSLARALTMGLHESSLDGFYHVARALCVHREADLDPFDVAFSAHFKGVKAAALEIMEELEQWLSDPKMRKTLTEEERALLESLDMEELRKLFEQRMKEQDGRHDGGNKWIGTGGTSPFGSHGAHPSGVRLGKGGGRSAMAVNQLAQAGLTKAYNVIDGMEGDAVTDPHSVFVGQRLQNGWKNSGCPWSYKPTPERMVYPGDA